MVPKLHAKGSSFKGAAAYLLHDKGRADTSERVAWTEIRNLAVHDPQLAWRVMAATALDQKRLKAQAGVKNTGRKSDKHVLHLTLSWHPEQSPSREDMIQAADQAIQALGAGDRQAMIVAHNDEDHPHVHVLINRVSPQDGRHLSSSKEKLKLSEWAQAYEEQTGIYCENRIINNEMRKAGSYVRGAKNVARHLFEAQRAAAANDNDGLQAFLDTQRKKDAALSQKGRALAALHSLRLDKLAQAHRARQTAFTRRIKADVEKARIAVVERYRSEWAELNKHQRAEREVFESLETSLFGRAGNIVRTIRVSAQDVGTDKTGIISRAFRILTNEGERRTTFDRGQQRARSALKARQKAEIGRETKVIKAQYTEGKANLRATYLKERQDLLASHAVERDRLKADWKERSKEREIGLRKLAALGLQEGRGTPKPSIPEHLQKRLDALRDSQKAFERSSQPNTRDRDQGRDDEHER